MSLALKEPKRSDPLDFSGHNCGRTGEIAKLEGGIFKLHAGLHFQKQIRVGALFLNSDKGRARLSLLRSKAMELLIWVYLFAASVRGARLMSRPVFAGRCFFGLY